MYRVNPGQGYAQLITVLSPSSTIAHTTYSLQEFHTAICHAVRLCVDSSSGELPDPMPALFGHPLHFHSTSLGRQLTDPNRCCLRAEQFATLRRESYPDPVPLPVRLPLSFPASVPFPVQVAVPV